MGGGGAVRSLIAQNSLKMEMHEFSIHPSKYLEVLKHKDKRLCKIIFSSETGPLGS